MAFATGYLSKFIISLIKSTTLVNSITISLLVIISSDTSNSDSKDYIKQSVFISFTI